MIFKNDFLQYACNYHRMIGDKEFTPLEAYKIFHNFLKEINAIGYFKYCMFKEYGSGSYLYRKYFEAKLTFNWIQMEIHNTRNKNKRIFLWYTDIGLLFPFSVPYAKPSYLDGYWKTVFDLWTEYCADKKITYSVINLKNYNEVPSIKIQNLLINYGFCGK